MCSNKNNFENYFYLRNIDVSRYFTLLNLTPYLVQKILNGNELNKFCYYQFSTTIAK